MKLNPILAAALLAVSASATFASTSGVVISQAYGGGGNSGATLKNDFIELYNAGSAAVSLNGWSVQYNSTTGTSTWQTTALSNITLQPGQYYLVQESAGTGGTQNLPTPDATGTLALSGTGGKVALVSSTTALTGDKPSSASIVDLVGYGSANYFEGSAAAPATTNTTAVQRAAAGCTDTDQNSADFAAGTPAPRNTASPVGTCTVSGPTQRTIPEIQGSGSASPFVGEKVQTSGVVTLVTNNSFYMQDLNGDGNAATSDGILVYTGSAPTVVAGQLVQLQGTVAEFNTGAASNADTAAHTVTELTGISGISVLSSGNVITPTVVTLPESVDGELERYEGMLVTINGPLTVQQNYFLGRYGQLSLAVNGRQEQPTNRFRPGADAQALNDANNRARILLDDGTSVQNPNPTPYIGTDNTVRAGDTIATLTGVVDYGLATSSNTDYGDYKIQPVGAVAITRANIRPAVPATTGGNLRVASFNVLNFFTTFTDGTTADGQSGQGCTLGDSTSASNCRGANNVAEFERQRAKIVEAIAAIDADALGLMEMQNNGSTAVQNLVDALNAKVGAGTYAIVPDPAAGTGTDAIKVAMIYKPARLAPAGLALSDTDPVNNRPTLAQTLVAANGQRFTLVVNHLKSKSSCPAVGDANYEGNFDSGDGQGCWNAQRVQQAQRLITWVNSLSAGAGTTDAVLLGDFNAYAQEDPVATLVNGGFQDQIARFNSFGYSYVFNGVSGRLDHGFVSPSLAAKVTDATDFHINADEPAIIDYNTEFKQPACPTCGPDYYSATEYRSSDHDPMVMGLSLLTTIQGTDGREEIIGTAGDDVIIGGGKIDKITTGAGKDLVVINAVADAMDLVTDFVPGEDRVDLHGLLASIGYTGSDPIADGTIRVADGQRGAKVQLKTATSRTGYQTMVLLQGVSAADIVPSRDLVLSGPTLQKKRSRKSVH